MRIARGSAFIMTAGAIAAILTVVSARPAAFQRAADPTVPQLLEAGGKYVASYESSFGAVVAEERYVQSTNSFGAAGRRATTGDILLFNSSAGSEGAGWMAFRDVQTLDTKPFPSKPGRLSALAANPTREALTEAMRVNGVFEGLTIGNLPRTPAIPTTALAYLRRARQPFALFELEGMKTVGNIQAAVLKFSERPHARMTDADDFTISGRFWIDPATGRVLQTELSIASVLMNGKVEVEYASMPGIDAWMPVRMFERYSTVTALVGPAGRVSGGATQAYVDGLATYQGFQRFELKPALMIK